MLKLCWSFWSCIIAFVVDHDLHVLNFCWVSVGSLLSFGGFCWVSVEFLLNLSDMLSFCWVSLISVELLLNFGCSDSTQIQQNLNISTEITETQQKRNHRNATDSTQIQQSSYRAVVATSAISAGWDLVITTLKPPFRDTRNHHYASRCYITKSSYVAVVATPAMCMSAGWDVAITTWFGRYVYVCWVGHVVITT